MDTDYYVRNLFDKACQRLLFTFGLELSFFTRALYSRSRQTSRSQRGRLWKLLSGERVFVRVTRQNDARTSNGLL